LKVLHIGKYFPPFNGGLENYMRDAMVALARRGIDSIALVHRHTLSVRSTNETFATSGHNFHVLRTGMWARFLYTPISPAFPWHLRSTIRKDKPDLLHLHLPNPSAFWALLLPSARRIPWVVHWHSDVITAAQGRLMRLFYWLYRPFEYAVSKHATTIVATSPPYRDSSPALRSWLHKCQVVPLGVDQERFGTPDGAVPGVDYPGLTPGNVKRSGGVRPIIPLQVLAVGRLTYYKGFHHLIEAAAEVPDVHVDLVGTGEQLEQLEGLSTSLNLQDRVTFHGVLSDEQLAQQMMECDCLCLPSVERTEAFGMVLLEAMYFGKATIVSDVEGSGMGWVVDDGITGIKVKPADTDSLAEAFRVLTANRGELERMGRKGKEKFGQQFEINHAVAGLADVYQQAVNASDPGLSAGR
jgi:rhamnosyl/mannosyltransferase